MPRKQTLIDLETEKRRQREQEQRKREQVRFLPPGLAEEILTKAAKERAAVLARIEKIDAGLEKLTELRAKAKEAEAAAIIEIEPRARTVTRGDGTERIVKPRPHRVKGPAAIKARRRVHEIENHIATLKQERVGRQSELNDIVKVERAARQGTITAVLAITNRWRNRVAGIGEIAPQVRLAGTWTDRFGTPLPEGVTPEDVENLKASMPGRDDTPLEIPRT